MVDPEFNEKVSKMITAIQFSSNIRPMNTTNEYMGKWDEMEEQYSDRRKQFESLFDIPANQLTGNNLMKINRLRKVDYPLCLCDLAKCYIIKDSYYLAESLLYAAAKAGIKGAELLLLSLYGENNNTAPQKLLNAFYRVKNIDIWSGAVRREINNDIFWGCAMVEFGVLCQYIDNDGPKAGELLLEIINSETFSKFTQVKKFAKEQLLRLKSGK